MHADLEFDLFIGRNRITETSCTTQDVSGVTNSLTTRVTSSCWVEWHRWDVYVLEIFCLNLRALYFLSL